MRRDVFFYVEADIEKVFHAYLSAATNPPFGRTCNQEPYHTISFGVNYSFKYNMNGGSCHLHFLPCGNGTAVNMRFSLAQGMGARYGRYAADLNTAMQAFLPVVPQEAKFNVEDFLKPENQVTPASYSNKPHVSTPTPQTVFQSTGSICKNCGTTLEAGSRFCTRCGCAVSVERICPNCKTPAKADAAFCAACGTRL